MRTITLNRWQRLEALVALAIIVGLTFSGSLLGSWVGRGVGDAPTAYVTQAQHQVQGMLDVLNEGTITQALGHRRCYGSDQLSPCVDLTTSHGVTLQVMGPAFRLGVAVPVEQTDLAAGLKRQADRVDQDGISDHSVLAMLVDTMVAHRSDDPARTASDATADGPPASKPVPLVPAVLTVKGFDATPTSTDGTAMWLLTPTNLNPPDHAPSNPQGVWWFTVPLVLAGPALHTLRHHPWPIVQRSAP